MNYYIINKKTNTAEYIEGEKRLINELKGYQQLGYKNDELAVAPEVTCFDAKGARIFAKDLINNE